MFRWDRFFCLYYYSSRWCFISFVCSLHNSFCWSNFFYWFLFFFFVPFIDISFHSLISSYYFVTLFVTRISHFINTHLPLLSPCWWTNLEIWIRFLPWRSHYASFTLAVDAREHPDARQRGQQCCYIQTFQSLPLIPLNRICPPAPARRYRPRGRKRKLLIIEGTAAKGVDLMVISLTEGEERGEERGGRTRGKNEGARTREREMSRGHQAAMGNGKNFPLAHSYLASSYLLCETLSPFTGGAALRVCPVA